MRKQLIFGVALHLAGTSLALAQTATGVIRGRVQDSTGAVITDVHVTLIDERRNQAGIRRRTVKGSSNSARCRSAIIASNSNVPASKKR